jgi:hypothetical protein
MRTPQLDLFQRAPAPPPRQLATGTRDAAWARERAAEIEAARRGRVLTPRQQRVLDAIRQAGTRGLTNREIEEATGERINVVTSYTYRLRQLTLVGPGAERPCRVTGNTVQSWIALEDYTTASPTTQSEEAL